VRIVQREVIRTCVGCRKRKPKAELVRIVRAPDGHVWADVSGAAPGRGAYVCRDVACFVAARRRGRLWRALRTDADVGALRGLEEMLSQP